MMLTQDFSVSRPLEGATIKILSLGAGVQSTVVALMAASQQITGGLPDCAIFADTLAEPAEVYEHLAWLESVLPYPVYRVSAGNIVDDLLAKADTGRTRFAAIPYFVRNADGSQGVGRRQCTKEYKLEPIHRKVRELIGLKYRQRAPKIPVVEQWIGISTDEIQRMKDSGEKWITNRWPLIEARMDRAACLRWFEDRYPGRKLVKSACVICPYQSDRQWMLTRADPPSWQIALEVDAGIRSGGSHLGLNGTPYLHRSMKPLGEVVFNGQAQTDLFIEECEGMCGV